MINSLKNSTGDRIKSVMSNVFALSVEKINDDASQDSLEAWDSLKHMNLIVALEEEFGIEFDEDDIGELLNYKLIKIIILEKKKVTFDPNHS